METARRAAYLLGDKFPEKERVRLYIWEWPVRITHWVIVLSLIVLTVTGYYIYYPFLTSKANHEFVTGWMRFVHEVAGFVFMAALLVRMYWFFAGNKWARWPQFFPLGRRRWEDFKAQLAYYMFIRREPPFSVGHNPLAGLSYMVVFSLMIVEVLTGLALFQRIHPNPILGFFVGWMNVTIGVRYLRLIHFGIMFAMWAFFVHHVYSAVLIGIEERSGLVRSIFTGYKFFPGKKLNEDARREREKA